MKNTPDQFCGVADFGKCVTQMKLESWLPFRSTSTCEQKIPIGLNSPG